MAGIPYDNKDNELINVEKFSTKERDVFNQNPQLASESLAKRSEEIHSMANKLNNLQDVGLLGYCLKKYNISEKSVELIKAESFNIGIQEAKHGISKDENLTNILDPLTDGISEENKISLLNDLAKKNAQQTIGFNLEKARQDMQKIEQCIQPESPNDLKL